MGAARQSVLKEWFPRQDGPSSWVLRCCGLFFITVPLVFLPARTLHSGENAEMRAGRNPTGFFLSIPSAAEKKIGNSFQVLFVMNDGSLLSSAKVHALEKQDDRWRRAFAPMDAMIGKNGFAPPGEKREGDGRTPSGVFLLGTAFGYEPTVVTKMPYRQAADNDLWIDDPGADDYNRWVKKDETRASSFEYLRRKDDLYRYGIVIEYNRHPVVKGAGSAIFFHVWKGPGEATQGCVAISEKDILQILRWLDPEAKPIVVMGTEEMIKEGFKER